jgi:hypothetical protein
MKKTRIIFACALMLAVAGGITLRAAEEGRKEGKATVRTVHGTVQYLDHDSWLPVKPNMKFAAGVTIRTLADGEADLSVNGTASAVRVSSNTVVQIPTMSYVGTAREGDTTTMLDLKSGSILGNVKKVSANSRYEIMTPHGVAGIRGTDFQLTVTPYTKSDGTVAYQVTVSSITGQVLFAVSVSGQTAVKVLNTGESYRTPRGDDQGSGLVYDTPPLTQQSMIINAQELAAIVGDLIQPNNQPNNNQLFHPDPHHNDSSSL